MPSQGQRRSARERLEGEYCPDRLLRKRLMAHENVS